MLPPSSSASAGLSPSLLTLRQQAEASGTAAVWRRFAEAAEREGAYAEASTAYAREAAIYRQKGDPNAAQVEEMKSRRWSSEVSLFQHRAGTSVDGARRLERLEPASGCYLGAFIDRDDHIGSLVMESQRHGNVADFVRQVGKPHVSYFMYRSYGKAFPSQWVAYIKQQGAIPHIAWEPRNLSDVRDDAYLRGFVAAARQADWPIFIRFAGEMNGSWTPYHGNPEAYKQAFRRVHAALRAAPKVALIWCPNTVPQNNLDDYYPGDAYVDWVGVNMYSVLYFDNDPRRPAEYVNPVDLLDYVYRRYASRKPICIAEYAATHRAQVDPRPRPDFAIRKMQQLYLALPALYPRVKMVDWYDCNNLVHARAGRQLNNYLLTDDSAILAAYRRAIAHPWYLGTEVVRDPRGPHARIQVVPLRSGDSVARGTGMQAFVRSYVPDPRVYFLVDGRCVYATRRLDGYSLPLQGLASGRHRLEVVVLDDRGRRVAARAVDVVR